MIEIENFEAAGRATEFSEQAIAAVLENRIKAGVYGAGTRIPSERVLADEFGVSRRFVRMACALLVERGLMEKSHYRRPFVSLQNSGDESHEDRNTDSSYAQAANQSIAAILPSHPTFPGGLALVAGIHKILAYSGTPYRLTFIDTYHLERSEQVRTEMNAIKSLAESGAKGVIWWSYSEDAQIADVVRRYPEMPIVFIDRHPRTMNCDFVGIDDVESSRAAVEYLFDLGHTRVAKIKDPGNYSTILERAEGYRQAHIEREIPYSEDLVFHLQWSENSIQQAFERFYSLPDPPTALFTSNDYIAWRAIDYAEANGILVPRGLSVVGHGNIDRYSARQFLTSVDQPFEAMGKSAAKLLLKRLASRGSSAQSHKHIILPAPLITRGSSGRRDSTPARHSGSLSAAAQLVG